MKFLAWQIDDFKAVCLEPEQHSLQPHWILVQRLFKDPKACGHSNHECPSHKQTNFLHLQTIASNSFSICANSQWVPLIHKLQDVYPAIWLLWCPLSCIHWGCGWFVNSIMLQNWSIGGKLFTLYKTPLLCFLHSVTPSSSFLNGALMSEMLGMNAS